MKHLKKFEYFKSKEDWQVGDWVVAVIGHEKSAPLVYYSSTGKLVKNYKYEIIDILDTTKNGQTPERFPIMVKDIEGTIVERIGTITRSEFFLKTNFITLDEWELNQSANKYNI